MIPAKPELATVRIGSKIDSDQITAEKNDMRDQQSVMEDTGHYITTAEKARIGLLVTSHVAPFPLRLSRTRRENCRATPPPWYNQGLFFGSVH